MTKPLSPAARAVLDAFTEDNCLHDWKHNHYNIDALAAGQLVQCPRCNKRHRVLKQADAEQKLNQVRCSAISELVVVGIEGRYLPQAN